MMRSLVIRWVSNVAALLVAAWLLTGISYGDQWWTLLIAARGLHARQRVDQADPDDPLDPVHRADAGAVLPGPQRADALHHRLDSSAPSRSPTFWWGLLGAIIVSIVNGLLSLVLPDPNER